MSTNDNHINYVEFKANDLEKIKEFYTKCFKWTFTDYGPTYTAFSESGLKGGFVKTESEIVNGALIVLFHKDLDYIKNRIIKFGGEISKDIFSFLSSIIIWAKFSFVVMSMILISLSSDLYISASLIQSIPNLFKMNFLSFSESSFVNKSQSNI